MSGGIKRVGNGTSRARGIKTGVDNNPNRQSLIKINQLQFPVMTAWQSASLTYPSQWGTTTLNEARMRRVGDCVEVEGSIRSGTLTAGQPMAIPLPDGLSLDIAKLGTSQRHWFGMAWRCSSISTTIPVATLGVWPMFYDTAVGSTGLRVTDTAPGTPAGALFDGTRPINGLISSNDAMSFRYLVPVSGWDVNAFGTIEDIIGSSILDASRLIKVGRVDGSNPLPGEIGEYFESKGTNGSATNSPTNMTSLTLPPGDWALEGQVSFNASSGTPSLMTTSISTTSAVHGTAGDNLLLSALNGGGQGNAHIYWRQNITVQTTFYLVTTISTAGHTNQGYKLCATRRS
jgi:hypothetical protein